MLLSKPVVHGIYILCYLSRQAPGVVTSSNTIAEATAVPPEQASKVLQALAAAKLVISARGRLGGYILLRKLDRISIGDVLKALRLPDQEHGLHAWPGHGATRKTYAVHKGLVRLREQVLEVLANRTLASVIGIEYREESMPVWVGADCGSEEFDHEVAVGQTFQPVI